MYRGPGSATPCVLSFDYLRLAGHSYRVRAYTDSSPTCKENVSYFLILFFFFLFLSLHFVVVVFETIRYISSGLAAPIESWGFEFRVFFFSCFGIALTSVRYTACQRIWIRGIRFDSASSSIFLHALFFLCKLFLTWWLLLVSPSSSNGDATKEIDKNKRERGWWSSGIAISGGTLAFKGSRAFIQRKIDKSIPLGTIRLIAQMV
jgi:hypothetical protein